MRTKLQTEEPDIGFGDLGRRLGEMWHSLKEEEKEDYRYIVQYTVHSTQFSTVQYSTVQLVLFNSLLITISSTNPSNPFPLWQKESAGSGRRQDEELEGDGELDT